MREINHGLMVAWINRDLFDRCSNDVRKSTVFYDADKMFVAALPAGIYNPGLDDLIANTGVCYYSTGIV